MAEPPSKKRISERQLIRGEEEEDENTEGHLSEGFAKAGQDVLSTRRIVKARRPASNAGPSAAANPFAAVSLVLPSQAAPAVVAAPGPPSKAEPPQVLQDTAPAEAKVVETQLETGDEVTSAPTDEAKEEKEEQEAAGGPSGGIEQTKSQNVEEAEGGNQEPAAEVKEGEQQEVGEAAKQSDGASAETPSDFAQLSSATNAFSGSFGSGFANSTVSLGSTAARPAPLFGPTSTGFSFAPPIPAAGFGSVGSSSSFPSLSSVFGNSNGAPVQLFGAAPSSQANSSPGQAAPTSVVTLAEVPLETGEEKEKAVFAADSSLFEFVDGGKWKERGKGEVRVNLPEDSDRPARLVMRARGNFRLLLNANLFQEMKVAKMDGRGVTFACVNSGGDNKPTPATYAVKLKDEALASEFLAIVEAHKSRASQLAVSNPVPVSASASPASDVGAEPAQAGDAAV